MNPITTHLWFDTEAEEAAKFYTSVFKNATLGKTQYYPEAIEAVPGTPAPGSVMSVEFELEGQKFIALNGGKVPGFEFSPATSFMISCADQSEIDYFWEKLSAVPAAEQCGWCQDKFGLTWQVVPEILGPMLSNPDRAKVETVTAAFLQMKKFDIAALEKAYKQ